MSYLAGTITESSKIIILDNNGNNLVTRALYPEDTYTKLLLHFDESPLIDSSPYTKSLTLNGGIARTAPETQAMFGGFCGYFDGVDDYITIPDSADWYFPAGTDFTIDFWINFLVIKSGRNNIIEQTDQVSQYWNLNYDSGNLKLITSRFADINAAWTPSPNTWYHIALVRSGTTYSFYVNGSYVGGRVETIVLNDVNGQIFILWQENAYMDELRISKGIARWTSNFTPPTAAYTSSGPQPFLYNLNGSDRYGYYINNLTVLSGTVLASSITTGETTGYIKTDFVSDVSSDYTKLLLHFNESPLVDTMGKTLTLNGSVVRSAVASKFGGYSGAFNGTSQSILVGPSGDLNFGTDDFTIDCWIRPSAARTRMIVNLGNYGVENNLMLDCTNTNNTEARFCVRRHPNGLTEANGLINSFIYTTGVWYHYAVVKYNNVITLYIDGISQGTFTDTSHWITSYGILIGAGDTSTSAFTPTYFYNGYIDELRISKGIARWKHNFTPPTLAYTV